MTKKERRATEGPVSPTDQELEELKEGELEKLEIDAGDGETVVFE